MLWNMLTVHAKIEQDLKDTDAMLQASLHSSCYSKCVSTIAGLAQWLQTEETQHKLRLKGKLLQTDRRRDIQY